MNKNNPSKRSARNGKTAERPNASASAVSTPAAAGALNVYMAMNVGKLSTGSDHQGFATKLINDVTRCVSTASVQGVDNFQDVVVGSIVEALKAFEPKDPIEGMIAAQAVALHSASMECLRRAMLGQSPEVASKLRKDGANLARAMTDMIAALDRKRGKGQQHIRVERVMVSEGGQAIVGSVSAGTGSALASQRRTGPLAVEALPFEREGCRDDGRK